MEEFHQPRRQRGLSDPRRSTRSCLLAGRCTLLRQELGCRYARCSFPARGLSLRCSILRARQHRLSWKIKPNFSRLIRLTTDELWLRPVDELVADEIALYSEEFSFIIEDLFSMPAN